MANTTVYPYGTGGSLPSSVGIIDDFTTGGADKALSAEQGKVLKEELDDATTYGEQTFIDISACEEKDGFPAVSVWAFQPQYIETHISIPVTPGQKFRIRNNDVNGSAIFLLKQDDVVTTNAQVPSFADGVTERIVGVAGEDTIIVIPATCNYLAISKSYSVENDYFPTTVSYYSGDYLTLKDKVTELDQEIRNLEVASTYKEIDLSQAVSRSGDVNTLGKWASGSHELIGCVPGSYYYVKGGQYIIWLKNNNAVVDGADAPVSDFAKYQILLEEGKYNTVVSPKDANYMLFKDISSLLQGDAYTEKPVDTIADKVSYLANRSAAYIFNEVARGWTVPGSSMTDILVIHSYAAMAKGFAQLVASGKFDEGLVYNTPYACKVQAYRTCMRPVNCHIAVNVTGHTWGGQWNSGIQVAWLAATASILPEMFTETEMQRVKTMLAYEADRILNITSDSDLYWSTDPSSYDGDSRADDDAWNAECLAMAVDLLEGTANHGAYKRKFIELSIISNAMPSDKSKDININGYNLTNLRGYNYLDNGVLYNHNILHPDYMMSWVINSVTAFMVKGKDVPMCINHNVRNILHSLTDVEYVGGSSINGITIRYPGGTIFKESHPLIYYPMGNDWAKTPRAFRGFIIAGVRGYVGAVDNDTDWSRMASILADFTIGMKKRFTNGGTYLSGDECDYRVTQGTISMMLPESLLFEQMSSALICLTFPYIFTEDAWYKYTVNGTVSGVSSGTIKFTQLFGDEVSYEATITGGAFSIELGGGQYGISITGHTLDTTSVNVTADTTLAIVAS